MRARNLFRTTASISASILLSALPIGAEAQESSQSSNVIISCIITSGEASDLEQGSTYLFKIGSGKWLVWSAENLSWDDDYCEKFSYASSSCAFTPGQFSLVSVSKGIWGTVKIDRTSGELTASLKLRGGGEEPVNDEARGVCSPALEPNVPKTAF